MDVWKGNRERTASGVSLILLFIAFLCIYSTNEVYVSGF